MKRWTFDDIPDQAGRIAIVTGANTGIGLETARMLAMKGAHVVLACRNAEKGKAAIERIVAERAAPRPTLGTLDLSDLASVRSFADAFASEHARLDLLINNAGVMVPPFARTAQGFELQFGTNHLGHFALTAHLLPCLLRAEDGRVVMVSSAVQRVGRIAFDDLNWERRPYRAFLAYAQSKLANMLFALELHRRALTNTRGTPLRVMAAHPGWTATDLQRTFGLARTFNALAMSPPEGALPTLRAGTDPEAQGGSYWGPSGLFEVWGPPVAARIPRVARAPGVGEQLFAVSEALTGVAFPKPR